MKSWPAQGEWTYEDYLRLPDDGKPYEIIEGVLYVANAPDFDHQFTVAQLLRLIGNFVAAKVLGVVLTAPGEYALLGQFGPGEKVRSKVLEGMDQNKALVEKGPEVALDLLSQIIVKILFPSVSG